MKRVKRVFTIIAFAVALAAVLPSTAHAAPCDFTATTTSDGITYAVAPRLRAAAVKRVTSKKAVTIPATVKYRGRTYKVRAIWDGAIPKQVRRVNLRAVLDTCEDERLWHVDVRATNRGVFEWLRATGAHVRRK
jgi:hypothetical protein